MRSSLLLAALCVSIAGCGGSGKPGHDGGVRPDGGPMVDGGGSDMTPTATRTLTTRPLAGTSTQSLLLDPFTTIDTSWGHFRALSFATPTATTVTYLPFARDYVSQSPAGVSLPVTQVALAAPTATQLLEVRAPLTGATTAVNADVWVAATNAAGSPVDWAAVASNIGVVLQANDQTMDYPLTPVASSLRTIDGQPWVQLALASPVPLPEGGWFVITADNLTSVRFRVQAPEVVPTTAMPAAKPQTRARDERSRVAVAAYVQGTRERPRQPLRRPANP